MNAKSRLSFKRNLKAAALSLLLLTAGGFCRWLPVLETSAKNEKLHWWDYYRFLHVNRSQIDRLKEKYGYDDFLFVGKDAGLRVYRVPKELADKLKGYKVSQNGPFKFIDPNYERRYYSKDPSVFLADYKTNELVEKVLNYYRQARPGKTRLYTIGTSVEGRPIRMLRISDRPYQRNDRPAILFNGAHHGSELMSVEFVLDIGCELLDLDCPAQSPVLSDEVRKRYLKKFDIYLVPVVNPDGLHECWHRNGYLGRTNANGVDLNRNYPFLWNSGHPDASSSKKGSYKYRGPSAASEPETKAMMKLAERERFALAFSFHTFATKILVPYTIDTARNPRPHMAADYGRQIAKAGKSRRSQKPYIAARKLYPVDGTDQDWLFHNYGTLAYIVEGSMGTPPYKEVAVDVISGMRLVSLEALEILDQGSILTIKVKDTQGKPVEAVVKPVQWAFLEGERFTTNPATGRFDLAVPPDKTWTIEVSAPGFRTQKKKVRCKAGGCRLDFLLEHY